MTPAIKNISRLLRSRLARNIYLWAMILFFAFNNDVEHRTYPAYVYTRGILCTTALFMLFTIVNNFIVIPRTLARRKYLLYAAWIAFSVFLFSFCYVILLKYFVSHYPKIEIHQISFMSTIITTKWTWAAIGEEMGIFFSGYLMWITALTMGWYVNDYTRQQKLLDEVEKKQKETELHFLKNQINPHFLFNTLNNLYGLSLKKSEAAPEAILELSSILRYLLYDSDVPLVPFEKEEEIMKAYIALELLRLPPSDTLTFRIEADRKCAIPPLLWLPVLENVFKHATRVITDYYFIDFRFIVEDEKITIYSCNNYKPEMSTGEKRPGGIGLENLRKRLELIYPGKYNIETSHTETLYTVEVQINTHG